MTQAAPDADVLVRVAFSLFNRPGAYALLLGSGVSTGAGVRTGWQIVQELICELSTLRGSGRPAAPTRWYEKEYGEPPTYPALVKKLAPKKTDRHALIERLLSQAANGEPLRPSAAHRSIAKLVSSGLVRVVLTTNFDPLLDQALAEESVEVTILSTPDSIMGALPLVHTGVLLVKLHGDHRDPRILNTEVELEKYAPPVRRLLDRVLDEYGLIVCGWSGEHDAALRNAFMRATTRRFATYWTARKGVLSPEATTLAVRRDAELVSIVDADDFFSRLLNACEALESARRPHPLSVSAAVGSIKRGLGGQSVAVPVHDTIRREIERIRRLKLFSAGLGSPQNQIALVDQAFGELEILAAVIATAAYWGDPESDGWWLADIHRIAQPSLSGGDRMVLDRPRIPALVIAWAAGIASVAKQRDALLHMLFTLEETQEFGRQEKLPSVLSAGPNLLHVGDHHARLYRLLRPLFTEQLALGKEAYIEAWERWQYLLWALAWDAQKNKNSFVPFNPEVRINGLHPPSPVPHEWLVAAVKNQKTEHPLLSAGAFNGNLETALSDLEALRTQAVKHAEASDYAKLTSNRAGVLPSGIHFPGSFEADHDDYYQAPP